MDYCLSVLSTYDDLPTISKALSAIHSNSFGGKKPKQTDPYSTFTLYFPISTISRETISSFLCLQAPKKQDLGPIELSPKAGEV